MIMTKKMKNQPFSNLNLVIKNLIRAIKLDKINKILEMLKDKMFRDSRL